MLNYCLLTVAGARIDLALAAIDRSLGFNWPAVMTTLAPHTFVTACCMPYYSMMPQMALLSRPGTRARVYRHLSFLYCNVGRCGHLHCSLVCRAVFRRDLVYGVPAAAAHMKLALDQNYAQILIGLLAHGPGYISPIDIKGLIGFPSYHAVLALTQSIMCGR